VPPASSPADTRMSNSNPPEIRPETWQANLKALQSVDAALADRLASLPIPQSVQPAVGRDGQPTFRICGPDGRTSWFGRTSMPTISAEGLLGLFAPGTANVALPGIGSGREAQLLGQRLGRHRATFVLETDPLNLALALRLWDLSAALRNYQVFLLLSDDLPGLRDKLVQLCTANIGLDMPGKMLAWPWRTKAQNQPWQDLIEQAAWQVSQPRNQCLADTINRLCRAHKLGAPVDAVAVLTITPSTLSWRTVEALADGARVAGLPAISCWPANPLHAGALAGLSAAAGLADRSSNLQIILVDSVRRHWPLQDANIRLVSWLVATEQLGETFQPLPERDDWVVASNPRQREHLLSLGWPERRVLSLPPFITPKAFDCPEDAPRDGIALLHDLVPEDPEQAGITLYSHQVLWRHLRDRLNKQPDAWHPAEAQRWLLAAQQATGIDLADPAVQEQFAGFVQRYLAPSVILARAARSIVQAGLPLRLYGRGWNGLDCPAAVWAGPLDDPEARMQVLRQAKVTILGDIHPGQDWTALEAAAGRIAIMCRALWPDNDPTALLSPQKELVCWSGQQELLERLRHLLRDDAARTQLTRSAHQRAMEQHSATVRLRQVLEAMREGQ